MQTPRPNSDPAYLASQGLSSDFPIRFMSKVEITDTHWFWTGTTRFCSNRCPKGHGQIQRMNGRNWKIYVHRASWILFRGPIPEGKMVLHNCPGEHVPYCVNPDHLKLGDGFDNMQDMTKAGHNHFALVSYAGEKHGRARLTQKDIDSIRVRHAAGERRSALAAEFGVSHRHVARIVTGHVWRSVEV